MCWWIQQLLCVCSASLRACRWLGTSLGCVCLGLFHKTLKCAHDHWFVFVFFLNCRGSIDCIQLINEEHMVSGADDG